MSRHRRKQPAWTVWLRHDNSRMIYCTSMTLSDQSTPSTRVHHVVLPSVRTPSPTPAYVSESLSAGGTGPSNQHEIAIQRQGRLLDRHSLQVETSLVPSQARKARGVVILSWKPFSRIALSYAFPYGKMTILVLGSLGAQTKATDSSASNITAWFSPIVSLLGIDQ